ARVDCPLWIEALDKIFGGDADLIRFVRRLFGSAMVGQVVEHVLPIFWGRGANGKSVIAETMQDVFGEYGGKAPGDPLLVKRGEVHPTERAGLHGKRLVMCMETDEGRRMSEAITKELTGGDTVTARRVKEDFWSFKPSHTLVLATNHKPRVHGSDHAIW